MTGILSYGAFAAPMAPARTEAELAVAGAFGKGAAEPGRTKEPFDAQRDGAKTSRRRRLWELPAKYHCPLIGVCFDVAELRRMVGKALDYPPDTTDYVWHTIAVGVCDKRCPLSEQFNRLLDKRFALMIRRMAACKTAPELRAAWREVCRHGTEIPAGLWAACTHPACDRELEQEIQADIHMIQHQVGAGARIDLQAMKNLEAENRRLRQEAEAARKRCEQLRADHAGEAAGLNRRISALQADLSAQEASVERLRGEMERLRAMLPDLDERVRLQARLRNTEERLSAARERETNLENEVARLRDFAAYAEETIEALVREPDPDAGVPDEAAYLPGGNQLLGKCVLCVGGRSGAVNSYRSVVERQGGRFMHHDGGREESLHRIDGALAAADIVICQVGCISHNAYWRVKEQCKRTGKPCMFVKSTGTASFGRVVGEAGGNVDKSVDKSAGDMAARDETGGGA
jgi:hypothetical protein